MRTPQKPVHGTQSTTTLTAPLSATTSIKGEGFLTKFAASSGIGLSLVLVVVAVVFPVEGAKEQDWDNVFSLGGSKV